MTNKALTLLLIIASLLLAALITHNGDLAWMTLPFLAYLGVGILRSPTAENIHLRAERSVEKTGVGDEETITVRVIIRNQGAALDRLELSDPFLPGMHIGAGQVQRRVALPPGESALLEYTFPARRASFAWETVHAVVSDPFSLVETPLDLPAEARIQIQPELHKFRPFPLRPQHTLHSAGAIPARLGGSGTDFWGIREYHPGDPLRRLDWRLAARYPRKFFTKEFEQEEIADIGLILDARRKTDLQAGEDSLFEHSARAAASLAEVLLRQGNRVSLLAYGKTLINVYPGYGKVQLNRILRALAQVNTAAGGSLDSLQYIPVHLFSSHSLILIFSPLAANDWRLFPRLRAYGYQVLLVSPDPVDFYLRTHHIRRDFPADPVTGLAVRLAGAERRLEIARITRLWIPVIDWQVDQPLSPLVRSTLSHLHIRQQR